MPYPTLTRKLRALGIGTPRRERCARVPDEPGAEMQHDTTVYQIALGGQLGAPDRQPAVPALLEAAVPEVLPRVQPLQDEVLLP